MDGMGNAGAAGDDPIELEEKYHDIDNILISEFNSIIRQPRFLSLLLGNCGVCSQHLGQKTERFPGNDPRSREQFLYLVFNGETNQLWMEPSFKLRKKMSLIT